MENSTRVTVTSTKVTVAKTNYVAARAKSRLLWNCKTDLSRNDGGCNLHLDQSSVTLNTTEYSCTSGTMLVTTAALRSFSAALILLSLSQ